EHSDRGCGETDSAADTGTPRKPSCPTHRDPNRRSTALSARYGFSRKATRLAARRYARKAKHTAAARRMKIRNTSNPDRGERSEERRVGKEWRSRDEVHLKREEREQ